jgi:hypothetical protein
MKYFKVYPEVPGVLGVKTNFDKSNIPWIILDLNIYFQGWLGCNLLTASPCFFATEVLKSKIEKDIITGISQFKPIIITKAEIFYDVHGDLEIPPCYWLEINGIVGKDDIGLMSNDLILSERFMSLLEDDLKIGIMRVEECIL